MARFICLLACAVTASAAALQVRDTTCNPGPVTINSRQCTIECGKDHPGGDYANLGVANLQSCVNACAADSKCFTAQYSVGNSHCYLKSHNNPATSASGINGVVCQTAPTCTPGNVTVNGRQGYVECGVDHPGGDYPNHSGYSNDNLEICEGICAQDPNCVTAQWTIDSQVCYLKSALNAAVANPNVNGIVFYPTTTSTATGTPTPTVPAGCGPVVPESAYIVNGGFERGLNPGSNTWSGDQVHGSVSAGINYKNSFEGCWSLHIKPVTPPDLLRQYNIATNITSLQPGNLYNFSFRLGHQYQGTWPGPAPYVVTLIDGQQIMQTQVCGFDDSTACQFNGPAGSPGSLITGQFTGSNIQSKLGFNFIWPAGEANWMDIIFDDVEISPAS